MKHIRRALIVLGFIFQYGIPLWMFSSVIPYTHGEIGAGLTGAGFTALGIIALIFVGKLKDKTKGLENKTLKEALLSIFPIVFWAVGLVAIKALQNITASVDTLWARMIIFILIGRLLYIVSAVLYEKEEV